MQNYQKYKRQTQDKVEFGAKPKKTRHGKYRCKGLLFPSSKALSDLRRGKTRELSSPLTLQPICSASTLCLPVYCIGGSVVSPTITTVITCNIRSLLLIYVVLLAVMVLGCCEHGCNVSMLTSSSGRWVTALWLSRFGIRTSSAPHA